MRYDIQKNIFDGIEMLPDIVDTPIWKDYDPIFSIDREARHSETLRLIVALYNAVSKRDNYYQEHTPTAFGDPEYSFRSGLVQGILQAGNIEERHRGGKTVFLKGRRIILTVENLKRPVSYYEAKKDNYETLKALGF